MLAAVCAYFNPCGYKSRRRNFEVFRKEFEKTKVPLLTVELLFDPHGASELGPCGNVLTIRGGDIMWQRERLLQIGIDELLNDGADAIAWLDADIVFHENNWHDKVLHALERFDCVQSFAQLVSHYQEGSLRRPAGAADPRSWAHGGSWAATREFWSRVKLYQHCILGGADTVMASLFLQFGRPDRSSFVWPERNIVLQQLNAATRAHVAEWAKENWAEWRVGFVPEQTAYLLPHGARSNRHYLERWELLSEFDPHCDVEISASGAFRWRAGRPPFAEAVRNYFFMRQEDG